uniref:Putative conserved secreted protein n=1 Tax=Culex tarsalis TaxID=7177 RepID=A0A1Q3FSL4_CULTA
MFKLVLISALVVAATCAPADKPNQQQGLDQSETQWNAAWANPAVAAAAVNPNAAWQNPNAAAWGANSWNRWGNNPADPRARWAGAAGAEPWNRWGNANPTAWNAQPWNRAAAGAWPAAGAPAAAARGWNPW